MPLQPTPLRGADGRDREDLLKIYADWPAPLGDLDTWLDQRFAAGELCFAGRFNDRLLAALWLSGEGEAKVLHHMCVRRVARGRGVARQLLSLLCRRADHEQWQLRAEFDDLPELPARELGFTETEGGWHRAPLA